MRRVLFVLGVLVLAVAVGSILTAEQPTSPAAVKGGPAKAAPAKLPPSAIAKPVAAGEPQRMTPSRTTPREGRMLASVQKASPDLLAEETVQVGPARYVVYNIEFKDADSCKAFAVDGVTVFNRFERFADVFIVANDKTPAALTAVRAAPGYVWDEFASNASAPPPQIGSKGTTRAIPDQIVRGGINDIQGQGVIVVIIDTGLDFHNPDFIDYDKDGLPTSRLRYFWDTTGPSFAEGRLGEQSPVVFPNGASIGTLYGRDDLNKELRSFRPLIPVWDIDGHGTACAGVAAGNGNNSDGRYKGVAPKADIIGVRLGDSLESCYLLNAICGWLNQIAGETPMVISCSFGGKDGGHDGMKIEERQLTARFPLTAKGRALCIAAGNDGGFPLHAELTLTDKAHPANISWSMPADGYLAVYYDTGEEKDLRYVVDGKLDLKETGGVNPLTGKYVSYFNLPAGTAGLRFYRESGEKTAADAYLCGYGASNGGRFDSSCASFSKLVQCPGSAHHAITVGSYDWNDQFEQNGQVGSFTDPLRGTPLTIGALSGYSSTGPLRIAEVVKPDIVAPGQYYAAPASRNTVATRDTTGRYKLFNGTSAATPYTAGVIALVMQKKPTITLGEIKDMLTSCGSQDRFTGTVPNPKWGHGKLDVKAVKKMLDSLK